MEVVAVEAFGTKIGAFTFTEELAVDADACVGDVKGLLITLCQHTLSSQSIGYAQLYLGAVVVVGVDVPSYLTRFINVQTTALSNLVYGQGLPSDHRCIPCLHSCRILWHSSNVV